MELAQAEKIAKEVIDRLSPYCSRIEIAGSIRRRKREVRDVDIVLIPSDPWNLEHEILGLAFPARPVLNGNKLKRLSIEGHQIDLYYATEETWATLFLIRTGSTEHNIKLCSIAKKKDWHLAANGTGLFNEKGERVAGDTEASVFSALGLEYIPPEKRG